jgi:hypothetical protein
VGLLRLVVVVVVLIKMVVNSVTVGSNVGGSCNTGGARNVTIQMLFSFCVYRKTRRSTRLLYHRRMENCF